MTRSGLVLSAVWLLLSVAFTSSRADELTGTLREQEQKKGHTPFLEIDGGQFGLAKQIELSGESLKNVPEGTRIWIEGEIQTSLAGDPKRPDATQSRPHWRIVFVVDKCKPISKPFEIQRKTDRKTSRPRRRGDPRASPHVEKSELTKTERDVLQNYHTSPAMVERAARICLARRLTKAEALQYTGDTMHRAVGKDEITFSFAPSQWWTLTFDADGRALTADITGKTITRDGKTWSPRRGLR